MRCTRLDTSGVIVTEDRDSDNRDYDCVLSLSVRCVIRSWTGHNIGVDSKWFVPTHDFT